MSTDVTTQNPNGVATATISIGSDPRVQTPARPRARARGRSNDPRVKNPASSRGTGRARPVRVKKAARAPKKCHSADPQVPQVAPTTHDTAQPNPPRSPYDPNQYSPVSGSENHLEVANATPSVSDPLDITQTPIVKWSRPYNPLVCMRADSITEIDDGGAITASPLPPLPPITLQRQTPPREATQHPPNNADLTGFAAVQREVEMLNTTGGEVQPFVRQCDSTTGVLEWDPYYNEYRGVLDNTVQVESDTYQHPASICSFGTEDVMEQLRDMECSQLLHDNGADWSNVSYEQMPPTPPGSYTPVGLQTPVAEHTQNLNSEEQSVIAYRPQDIAEHSQFSPQPSSQEPQGPIYISSGEETEVELDTVDGGRCSVIKPNWQAQRRVVSPTLQLQQYLESCLEDRASTSQVFNDNIDTCVTGAPSMVSGNSRKRKRQDKLDSEGEKGVTSVKQTRLGVLENESRKYKNARRKTTVQKAVAFVSQCNRKRKRAAEEGEGASQTKKLKEATVAACKQKHLMTVVEEFKTYFSSLEPKASNIDTFERVAALFASTLRYERRVGETLGGAEARQLAPHAPQSQQVLINTPSQNATRPWPANVQGYTPSQNATRPRPASVQGYTPFVMLYPQPRPQPPTVSEGDDHPARDGGDVSQQQQRGNQGPL